MKRTSDPVYPMKLILRFIIIALILVAFISSYRTSSSTYRHPSMKPSSSSSEKGKEPFPFTGISFHASGWMQIYQGGVAKYIQENYKLDTCKMVGTSGGALIACTLCCDIPMDLAFNEMIGVRKINKHNNVFQMCPHTKEVIKKMLPLNCIELIQDRLTIVCSKLDNTNVEPLYKRTFGTYIDVMNYLNATVHIPIFDGIFPQTTDNELLYDGMLTDSHSGILDPCLKVTWDSKCYCGCTLDGNTIFPDIEIPLSWCVFPPDERILELLYFHGYYSAQKYFSGKDDDDTLLSETVVSELKNELERQKMNYLLIQGSVFLGGCLGVLQMI